MVLQESGEMYLESILVLIRQGKAVRSIDIVDYMGYSKPSVSRAVGLLKAGQYIDVDNGGYITLDRRRARGSRKDLRAPHGPHGLSPPPGCGRGQRCRGRLPHGARHQ